MPQPNQRIPHLWVIATEPNSSGEVVIVNMTSPENCPDRTVIVCKGDHPFVTHDSVINFADAKIGDATAILHGINSKLCHQCDPCSASLVEKIQQGIIQSDFTPNKIKEYCDSLWNNSD